VRRSDEDYYNTKQKENIRKRHDTQSADAWLYDKFNKVKKGEEPELLKIKYKVPFKDIKVIHERIYD